MRKRSTPLSPRKPSSPSKKKCTIADRSPQPTLFQLWKIPAVSRSPLPAGEAEVIQISDDDQISNEAQSLLMVDEDVSIIQKNDAATNNHTSSSTSSSSFSSSSSFISLIEKNSVSLDDHDDINHDDLDISISEPTPSSPSSSSSISSSSTSSAFPFSSLAAVLQTCESTPKRTAKISALQALFRDLLPHPDDLVHCFLLASGAIAPPFEGVELGLGVASVLSCVSRFSGLPPAQLRSRLRQAGDLGTVAAQLFSSKQQQKSLLLSSPLPSPPQLPLSRVMRSLLAISSAKGAGSLSKKLQIAASLLSACASAESVKFLVRILCQDGMRVGVQDATLQTALAAALGHAQPAPQELVRGCFEVLCDVRQLIPILVSTPLAQLPSAVSIRPGTPVRPMLASPASDFSYVLQKMRGRQLALDFKYDGERCQLHRCAKAQQGGDEHDNEHDDGVHLFSRHLERSTSKFPEIVEALRAARCDEVFIMDGEIVLFDCSDPAAPVILPFQQLSRRSQWQSGDAQQQQQQQQQPGVFRVSFIAFDLLFWQERSLVMEPLAKRRALLAECIAGLNRACPDRFKMAQSLTLSLSSSSNSELESDPVISLHTGSTSHLNEIELSSNVSLPSSFLSSNLSSLSMDPPPLAPIEFLSTPMDLIPSQELSSASSAAPTIVVDPDEPTDEEAAVERIRQYLEESIAGHTEGLIIKDLQSRYYMNKRGYHWLKLKRDYLEGMADSIDVLVVGAYWGRGRRAQWFGAFLFAILDVESGVYQTLCKCMTGYTDVFMQEAVSKFPRLDQKPSWLHTNIQPSVWLDSSKFESVWEIRGADLTLSLNHTAALGMIPEDRSRAISLRFPRFLRIRPDKSRQQVTSTTQLVHMYQLQSQHPISTFLEEED